MLTHHRKFPHFAVPFVNHTIVYSSPPQYTFTAGPVKKNEFGGNGIEKKTAGPAIFASAAHPSPHCHGRSRQAAHRFARRSLLNIRSRRVYHPEQIPLKREYLMLSDKNPNFLIYILRFCQFFVIMAESRRFSNREP